MSINLHSKVTCSIRKAIKTAQENQQLDESLQEAKEAIETMRQQMEELRIEKEDRDGTTSAAPQAKKQARTQRRTKASKIHRHSEGTGAQAAELTGRH